MNGIPVGPVDAGRRVRFPSPARRVGINVRATYTSVFVVCSGLAAARSASANQSSGTGDVNLNAIAAAVIGGTSLFGGRGSAWSRASHGQA